MRRLLLLLFASILLFSCSDEEILNRKENKLVGTWEFNKAFYKRDGALFRRDVMGDFRYDEITFYHDYYAYYYDYSLDAGFDGDWALILDHVPAGYDDTDHEFFMEMRFYDYINRHDFFYDGRVTYLTRRRLTIEVYDGHGMYTFKFRKVD
jgi:hypothetical protein